jgi:hypothetical protein
MSFYQELPYPVFIGTGQIRTTGKTEDLKAGEVGLFDAATYRALDASANGAANPEVFIGGGSWHSTDKLTKFIGGLQESTKTQSFLGKDVLGFEFSKPISLKEDIIQIGWDGVNDCDSLAFECGKSYFYKVNVESEDVFRTFSRPLYRFIEVKTECCDEGDCATGCDNTVDPKVYSRKLAQLINDDPELKYFVKAQAVASDYSAPSATHTVYNLTVCDNGDVAALGAVQSQYTDKVTRVSRVDSISTYELIRLTGGGTPTAFSQTQPVLEAVCGTCPSGYTTVVARDVYVVRRPLAGTESLINSGAQTTYAGTIRTAYSAAVGTYLGQDGAVAIVQLEFTAGTVVTALLSDVVTLTYSKPSLCTPPAGSTTAWVSNGTKYKTSRVLCVTLQKPCGTSSNRLGDLQAFYAADTSIVPSTIAFHASGTCSDTYQLSQYNDGYLTDDCLASDVAVYSDVQSFEGFTWKECPCPDDVSISTANVGVRIKGAYLDTKFGDCSFEPVDYYRQRPIRITASEVNRDGSPCSSAAKVTKVQFGRVSTQSGEWLVRQYLKYLSLEAYGAWSTDPRMREVLDIQVLNFIDRTKSYKVYYVVYNENRYGANWNTQHPATKFESIIAFPEGTDTTTFEKVFGGYFSQFGVNLKQRGAVK